MRGGGIAGRFSRYRSALSRRDLRLLLGGLLISATGSWAYNVALLAFVFDRTHSLAWVAAAGLVRFITPLVLSPYGGVIAERIERVRLMVSADALCALWQVGLVGVAASNGPVVLGLVFSALTSATNVIYIPAVAATIPAIVDEEDLVAANALSGMIDSLVVTAGPALGGILLLVASPAAAFAANAASFALSAVIVRRMRVRSRPVDVTEQGTVGPLAQMVVGVRTIAGLGAARTLVGYCALVSFVYGTDTVLLIAVSEHRLGTGSEGFGYLLASLGAGGLLMAATVDRLAASRRLAPIILAGVAGYCLPTALLTIIHSAFIAVPLEVVRGGSTLVVDVLAITSLQRAVPEDQIARVFGAFSAIVLGAIALGALITPPIVDGFGLNTALLILAIAPFVLGLLGFPALRSIDRATATRSAALAPLVELLEHLQIFAAASRPILERLASVAEEVTFPARTAIVREGGPADALYVLPEGEVAITAHGEAGGPERSLGTIIAPGYFGEIGILERIPRTATVTALTDCRCERIDGDVLLDALTSAPPSSSLIENARQRLATTHPSRAATYPVSDAS